VTGEKAPSRGIVLLIAAGIGLFLAGFIYFFFLQNPQITRREILGAGLAWLAATGTTYMLLVKFLIPVLSRLTLRGRMGWILASLTFGLLIAIVTRPPEAFIMMPVHTLEIQVFETPAHGVTIDWFTTSLGEVSFARFEAGSGWKTENGQLTYKGNAPATIRWQGRVGESARLVLVPSPPGGGVQVVWDGQREVLDLSPVNNIPVISEFNPPPSILWILPAFLCTVVIAGFFFLVVSLFLGEVSFSAREGRGNRKYPWPLYALPMIVVWGFFLLTFFPGLMSGDSYDQWSQVVSARFNDAHPVFHSLLLWVLTRLWLSTAAVVIFHILALSLTVAWGLKVLQRYGLPNWGAWLVAGIFALSPINGQIVITIWKDIPYSTAMLLFSCMILLVVFTRGKWLEKRGMWVWLGLVSALITLFRHNGLPITIFTLTLLLVIYRRYWRKVLLSFSLFLVIYLVVQYPLYNFLRVDRNLGAKQQLFVHHIAAHMVNGGPLTPAEQELAERIVPSSKWEYDCCSAVPTYTSPGYSEERNGEIAQEIRALFFRLLIKEPLVEINHQVCISSLVWEIPSRCKSVLFFPYDLSIFENTSLLPALIPGFNRVLSAFRDDVKVNALVSPAIYLILGLYATLFFSLRKRDLRFNLFMVPAGINSLVLIVVNLSANFRYQYGVYLVGLFCIGLLILGLFTPKLSQIAEGDPTSPEPPDTQIP
jgi:hypothetical protein